MKSYLKAISLALSIGGGILLLLGLLAGGASLMTSLERLQHGTGPLFADGEFFGLLALICCVLGAISLIVAKRLRRIMQRNE